MSSTSPQKATALIFGGSGITGWATAIEALKYPSKDAFERVIALTNRPLSREDGLFPADERLVLHSGVDLTKDPQTVVKSLRAIRGIEDVTHVYFSAYTGHGDNFEERRRVNVEILDNAIKAVEEVSPKLTFWTIQSGGKWYGMEFADKLPDIKPPYKEDFPRVPEPYGRTIFYYPQYDLLKSASAGKRWSFVDIRPDAIIGFVPNNNFMNIAQNLALWLSLYASIEGPGAEVPYPGSETAYHALHTDVSQDLLARFTIFASFRPETTSEQHYNISDDVKPFSYAQIWPGVCEYFGLKGVGPQPGKQSGAAWVYAHKPQWDAWVEQNGLKKGVLEENYWDFIDFLLSQEKDRHFDLTESRKLGFSEIVDHVQGYAIAFDKLKKANVIPQTVKPLKL